MSFFVFISNYFCLKNKHAKVQIPFVTLVVKELIKAFMCENIHIEHKNTLRNIFRRVFLDVSIIVLNYVVPKTIFFLQNVVHSC